MRIGVVNDWFSSSAPGGFYRIQGIAEALRNLGNETTLVCPAFRLEGGMPIPDVKRYSRLFDSYVRTPTNLLRQLRGFDADVFLIEMPFPWTKAVVAIVKSLRGKRVFLDFGEFWVEAANRVHFLAATTAIRVAARSASGISATTDPLRGWLTRNLGLSSRRVFYLPCGVGPDFLVDSLRRVENLANGSRDPVIGYTGTISREQGCDFLLKVAGHIHAKRPDARFLFVGDGPLLNSLRLQSKEVGLCSSATFTGRVPRDELPRLCARMDIGLSLKPFQGQRTIGTFPQKIPEYMSVGCVPVSTPLQEAHSIISQGVDGVIAEVDAMGEAVVSLLDDDLTRERMSRAAAAAARKRYDWNVLAKGLLDFWKETV